MCAQHKAHKVHWTGRGQWAEPGELEVTQATEWRSLTLDWEGIQVNPGPMRSLCRSALSTLVGISYSFIYSFIVFKESSLSHGEGDSEALFLRSWCSGEAGGARMALSGYHVQEAETLALVHFLGCSVRIAPIFG